MDYNNWYALSISTNKERSCKEQLLARRALMKDTNLLDVEYLETKEISVDKGGRRKVKSKPLMAGYLLVQVRPDVIEASVSSHMNDNFLELYKKTIVMNKYITKDLGKNALSTYKRASSILDQEKQSWLVQF